ncbi:DUF4381 domain-containing protein [Shewanella sp. D64]|uniref:DUF4381 domain-containing protein n=1 Tax=unclassified Shewanella TaxID=196818 RepID=UPI0022BA2310|nr:MULTISPECIES: DUF4381 domain-containing protein [unclassified Shewanella]MEC4728902.1 DUF4381 domain-containing protein [Shewanella sp. D64]MEC4740776.1 DUF4381 domain-containing protein [Shewanella sp. E94]WBJ97388.1 DUF4381 domain-containing protein [Shewanella sp. MTB7]
MQATAINPALEALKDIHTPAIVENWPIALGYWLVLLILVSTLIFSVVWLTRRYKRAAAKRAVIIELELLDINSANISVDINTLIKRAAISYLPREQVAGLQGQIWYAWMDQQVKHATPALHRLLDLRYQKQGLTTDEAQELKQLAKLWLKEALPLTAKTSNHSQSQQYAQKQEQEVKC